MYWATCTFGGCSPNAAGSLPGPSVATTCTGKARAPSTTVAMRPRSRLKTVPKVT
jgi:hypothetical protein